MYGLGRGGGRGRGMGGPGAGYLPPAGPATSASGYRYVGSCRCGFGPNAYYQDAGGRIVPASGLFSGAGWAPAASPASELEQLRVEKADLERRLGELERRLRSS